MILSSNADKKCEFKCRQINKHSCSIAGADIYSSNALNKGTAAHCKYSYSRYCNRDGKELLKIKRKTLYAALAWVSFIFLGIKAKIISSAVSTFDLKDILSSSCNSLIENFKLFKSMLCSHNWLMPWAI